MPDPRFFTGGLEHVTDSDIRGIELKLNRVFIGSKVSSHLKNMNVIGNHHPISMVENQTGPNFVERVMSFTCGCRTVAIKEWDI